MSLTMIVTNAGRAALVNAQHNGTLPVTIAQVGISAGALVPSPAATTLPGEIKRLATISGDVVAADTIHLIVRDETADAYTMQSWGLYLADGTLFGIYGQATPIIAKTAASIMLLAIDVRFADITAASLTFGNTNFLDPPATTTVQGVVELATSAEAIAGTDLVRAITAKAAFDAVTAWLNSRFGVNNANIWHPGNDGAASGLDADLLDGQQGAWYSDITGRLGYTPLNAATYTAADVKAKLLTVDGAGSGVDADLLDGQDGAYYANVVSRLGYTPLNKAGDTATGKMRFIGNITGNSVLGTATTDLGEIEVKGNGTGAAMALFHRPGSFAGYFGIDTDNQWKVGGWSYGAVAHVLWHSGNDGAGSGVDADLLDGQQGAWYADIVGRLGYTPLNSASYTAADVKAKLITVDGAGSGLDADLLDGQDGAYYANVIARLGYTPLNKAGDTMAGMLLFGAGAGFDLATNDIWASIRVFRNAKAGGDGMWIGYGNANSGRTRIFGDGSTTAHVFPDANGNLIRNDGASYWHSANDGAGSGVDADLLDGQQGTWYTDIVGRLGYTPLNSASYTAADVKTKLLTVDGAGSGVDADLLDGQQGTWYTDIVGRLGYTPLNVATYTAADVKTKLLTVDGAGSGLDADLLDGLHANAFALASGFQSGSNADGYWMKSPDGSGGFIIEQWGSIIATQIEGTYSITFPIAFPGACENVQVTVLNSSGNVRKASFGELQAKTNAGATYHVQYIDEVGTLDINNIDGIDWRAIGR